MGWRLEVDGLIYGASIDGEFDEEIYRSLALPPMGSLFLQYCIVEPSLASPEKGSALISSIKR